MKVTIIPIVIGDLGTVTKGLIKGLEDLEIRGCVETIQTTTLKKSIEHECDSNTNGNLYTWNNPQRIGKETGRHGNKKTRDGHLDYSIIKIGHNTEKSHGDKRILPVVQIPEDNH